MKTRIITALVLLSVFVPVLIFSHTVIFPIVISIVSLFATFEYLKCLGHEKDYALCVPAFVISLALPLASHFKNDSGFLLITVAVFALYLFYLFAYAVFKRGKLPFFVVSSTFTGIFYIIGAMVCVVLLRRSEGGEYLYLLVFISAWVTDTFAYFTGRFFGSHKLIEEISPKKTVEGSIGGSLFCIFSYLIFGFAVGRIYSITPNYPVLALSALVVSLVAQIGDLIFSLIKREHGIKDYGKIFPGHGGMLDRIDSIIPVSFMLYILVSMGGEFSFFA